MNTRTTAAKERPTEIQWIHPEPGDSGRQALERCGVGVGDEFLQANIADWEMPSHVTSRSKGDGLWQFGHVVVHSFVKHRLLGWYEPKDDYERGMVCVEWGQTNVVCGALRVSNIAGDPELKFPIAKCRGHSPCDAPTAAGAKEEAAGEAEVRNG